MHGPFATFRRSNSVTFGVKRTCAAVSARLSTENNTVRGISERISISENYLEFCGGAPESGQEKSPGMGTGAKERKITIQGANRRLGETVVWHPNQDRTHHGQVQFAVRCVAKAASGQPIATLEFSGTTVGSYDTFSQTIATIAGDTYNRHFLFSNCGVVAGCNAPSGLVVTETGSVAAVPLPAAFPLFATGLGALGLLGWRRKRKALSA
jgi:hypothetical protein